MARKKNKVTVEFTEDYAGREKGSTMKCDSLLASSLINRRKVAKCVSNSVEPKKESTTKSESVIETAKKKAKSVFKSSESKS